MDTYARGPKKEGYVKLGQREYRRPGRKPNPVFTGDGRLKQFAKVKSKQRV